MSKESDYHHIQEGEWFRPNKRGFREQCCDCGLVHTINFRLKDGHIEFQTFRNGPATGGARKNRTKK